MTLDEIIMERQSRKNVYSDIGNLLQKMMKKKIDQASQDGSKERKGDKSIDNLGNYQLSEDEQQYFAKIATDVR